ncbi:hypothetical protein C7444_105246 [Sphaerotilus hippei]|uniref:O-antigen ligase-like membrane protein n=1 Tax=Sphaerotilus hippei TaxID=744406 RepID=A0A318H519_9BURK|nr:O-antigen ligase family protein [Sphaerotilus hippei]PXW97146.1 hypothetical protein C7444_105246 [Sphaerotilus hippei]
MIPTYFAALVLLSAWWARGTRQLSMLLFWTLFGGSAAFILPVLGGASLSPAVSFLPLLLLTALRKGGTSRLTREMSDGQPGFWLLMLILWGVVGAIFIPRMLAGDIDVLTIDRLTSSADDLLLPTPLRPVSSNISQAAYALGSLLTFACVRSLLQEKDGYEQFGAGIMLTAWANVVAGLINMVELYGGLPSMLEYVRNGSYAMLNSDPMGGLQRLYGTFPESSAFAGFCLGIFAATLTLWRHGWHARQTGWLALITLLLLLLSTSTTGYVGLMGYLCVVLMLDGMTMLSGRSPSRWGTMSAVAAMIIMVISLLMLVSPAVFEPVISFFNLTLFDKMESQSGVERGSWNQQAWSNFLESYGLGVGLGSTRASSYPLVLLSNLGVIGTLLFVIFTLSFLGRSRPKDRSDSEIWPIAVASRHAAASILIGSAIAGTVFDLGIGFYAFAAAACGMSVQHHKKARLTS